MTTDRASATRTQATIQTHFSPYNTKFRTTLLHWKRPVYVAVRQPSLLYISRVLNQSNSYLIADNVVFLTIADKSYPRKLAFSYLDELSKEFANTYGPKVETVRKPYAFVGFGEQYLSPRLP